MSEPHSTPIMKRASPAGSALLVAMQPQPSDLDPQLPWKFLGAAPLPPPPQASHLAKDPPLFSSVPIMRISRVCRQPQITLNLMGF